MDHLYTRLCQCIPIKFRPMVEHTAWVWFEDIVSEAEASTYVPQDAQCGGCSIVATNDCLETILPLCDSSFFSCTSPIPQGSSNDRFPPPVHRSSLGEYSRSPSNWRSTKVGLEFRRSEVHATL